MLIELTEEEFEKMIKSRMQKAKDNGDQLGYNAHLQLFDYFKNAKEKGYKVKCYIDVNGGIYAFPFSKDELILLEKKYRECGIW